MHFVTVEDRRYAQFERLRATAGLTHAFSLRPANPGPQNETDGDGQRRQMARDWKLDPERICYCRQVHDTALAIVEEERTGKPLPNSDGVIVTWPEIPVMTFSADCPLVLAYDPVVRVLGLVHASWRCTIARLTARLVDVMVARFGCRARDVQAGVGPGAGPCCYEVKADVYQAAAALNDREQAFQRRDGRLFFDLWAANRRLLLDAGVPAEQIEVAGLCTMCRNDLFYSYRREGTRCGHFGLLAAMTSRGRSSTA